MKFVLSMVAALGLTSTAMAADLPDLGGRRKLEALGMEVHTLCAFEGL